MNTHRSAPGGKVTAPESCTVGGQVPPAGGGARGGVFREGGVQDGLKDGGDEDEWTRRDRVSASHSVDCRRR